MQWIGAASPNLSDNRVMRTQVAQVGSNLLVRASVVATGGDGMPLGTALTVIPEATDAVSVARDLRWMLASRQQGVVTLETYVAQAGENLLVLDVAFSKNLAGSIYAVSAALVAVPSAKMAIVPN